jgi:hypothetical protein
VSEQRIVGLEACVTELEATLLKFAAAPMTRANA